MPSGPLFPQKNIFEKYGHKKYNFCRRPIRVLGQGFDLSSAHTQIVLTAYEKAGWVVNVKKSCEPHGIFGPDGKFCRCEILCTRV